MLVRLIGIALLCIVLGGLYFVTEGVPSTQPSQRSVAPMPNDNSFKDLKIN